MSNTHNNKPVSKFFLKMSFTLPLSTTHSFAKWIEWCQVERKKHNFLKIHFQSTHFSKIGSLHLNERDVQQCIPLNDISMLFIQILLIVVANLISVMNSSIYKRNLFLTLLHTTIRMRKRASSSNNIQKINKWVCKLF